MKNDLLSLLKGQLPPRPTKLRVYLAIKGLDKELIRRCPNQVPDEVLTAEILECANYLDDHCGGKEACFAFTLTDSEDPLYFVVLYSNILLNLEDHAAVQLSKKSREEIKALQEGIFSIAKQQEALVLLYLTPSVLTVRFRLSFHLELSPANWNSPRLYKDLCLAALHPSSIILSSKGAKAVLVGGSPGDGHLYLLPKEDCQRHTGSSEMYKDFRPCGSIKEMQELCREAVKNLPGQKKPSTRKSKGG